ncbi:hypothetical protein F5Y05DRAFT_49756 [Hypoxylon sp. FL0543]|nr:hypothetical protein F5Y05DRAFT_49756 [Hypoxylon sp. FL0543]
MISSVGNGQRKSRTLSRSQLASGSMILVDDLEVDEPEVEEPVVEEPVVDEPVVDEPVVDEPVVDEPVEDEPEVDDCSVGAAGAYLTSSANRTRGPFCTALTRLGDQHP